MTKLQLGKRNQLKVLREKEHGLYLEGGDIGDILLPKRYVPEGTKVGDILDVFLYLDQEERLIATTEHPLIEVGQFAYLECAWTNEYGAYLNWGLMKDLFCPFREQKVRMQRGKRYLVYCYIDDKTYRIVCSSKIEKFQKAISEKDGNSKPSTLKPKPDRKVLIGDFSTPVSMAFRHYGNVMSGAVIGVLMASFLRGLSRSIFGGISDVSKISLSETWSVLKYISFDAL